MSEFSRETLLNIIETDHVQCGEASALARMALAAMDSEPDRNPVLAYADSYRDMAKQGVESVPIWSVITDLERNIAPLYRHAQPAPETECEPIAWLNDAYLARGVVDGEAGSEDAGPGCIPVYREASPAQPAPVVPDEMLCEFYEVANWPDLVRELVKHVEQLQDSAKRNVKPWEDTFPETLLPAYIDRIKQADEACRAAMLQAGISAVIPDGYVMVPVKPTMEILDEFDSIIDYGAEDSEDAWRRLLAAAQQPQDEPQNIPEIIPGWIPVSERMPDDDDFVYIWPRPDFGVELHVGQYCECSPKGDGWYAQVYEQNYGIEWYPITVTHWMPLPAAPQEAKDDINALIPLVSRNEQEVK